MSELKVDNLTGKTSAGDITVTSEGGAATMQLQQGLAKAWASVNGTGTASIRGSFNVASLTDNGTGNHSVALSNVMADNNGAVTSGSCGSANLGDLVTAFGLSSSVFKLNGQYVHGSGGSDPRDVNNSNGAIHGDLA